MGQNRDQLSLWGIVEQEKHGLSLLRRVVPSFDKDVRCVGNSTEIGTLSFDTYCKPRPAVVIAVYGHPVRKLSFDATV